MPTTQAQFETLLYKTDGPVATITLNRPDHLNTIVPPMPDEIEKAIGLAERDPTIKVIVLRGAGRAFSGGYDFGGGFHHWGDAMNTDGRWDPGKDFALVSARETGPTQKFMAIWRASKPVIAQVHGWCVGGASDYALCADIVIASDDAVIGTPYARMWGAYLTGMWLYRLSLAKAKWHSLTGEPLTGKEAAAIELINESVPFERLEARVAEVAAKLTNIPLSQLQAQKLIVNQAYENMGLASTQTLGGILDGLMRNTPDALRVHRHRFQPGCAHGDRAPRRAVGRLQPGPAGAPARPVAHHRALTPQWRSSRASRSPIARNVSLTCVHVLVPTNSPRMRPRNSASVIPRTRAALPIAPEHSCQGSTRTLAVTDDMVHVAVSTEPTNVYSCAQSLLRSPPTIDTITPNTTSTPPAASVRFSH